MLCLLCYAYASCLPVPKLALLPFPTASGVFRSRHRAAPRLPGACCRYRTDAYRVSNLGRTAWRLVIPPLRLHPEPPRHLLSLIVLPTPSRLTCIACATRHSPHRGFSPDAFVLVTGERHAFIRALQSLRWLSATTTSSRENAHSGHALFYFGSIRPVWRFAGRMTFSVDRLLRLVRR